VAGDLVLHTGRPAILPCELQERRFCSCTCVVLAVPDQLPVCVSDYYQTTFGQQWDIAAERCHVPTAGA
jgi:hypothetical protein